MISTATYNNKFVKKVSDITDLFSWSNSLESGFDNFPSEAVIIQDTIVNEYAGEDDKAYQHHATIGRKFGKIFFAHTIHDYDEDAGGMYTALNVSTDDGETWTELDPIMPQMSDMVAYGVTPAQWSYPSLFIDVPSGFYLLICCVSSLSYTPVGTAVRKINSNNTYGDVLWVNNGVSSSDRTVPTPVSGYPSYAFADEDLIDEITFYINQPKNKPKILFGWSDIWAVQGSFMGNNLREPTAIQPYNYDEWLKIWRVVGLDYNVVQNGENTATQVVSEMPHKSLTTATRVYQYSPEIIITVGASKATARTELMLAIYRKNNETGVYDCADGDAYRVSPITKDTPVWPGEEKWGGQQLPFIYRVGKDLLDIGFSVAKEQMYYKCVDISKLI